MTDLNFGNVTAAVPLVTVQAVKDQLKITGTAQDAHVQLITAIAQDEILSYLKKWADPTWTEATVPLPIKGQILRRAAFLYEDRGDTTNTAAGDPDAAAANWNEIRRALDRYRDPALA